MYKIVHKQFGMTAYFFDLIEEALELAELMLKQEPGQYYVRKIKEI